MGLLDKIRKNISPQNSFLLLYHKILAVAAAIRYGFPANRLKIIAVTGTKGKSTVAHLLASILKEAGGRVGVASTIHFQIGDTVWNNDTKQTTQGPFKLQRLLSEMAKARCEYAVIEVTSHALMQSRLWGVNADIAILTNIDRDHIEYHGGFENYLHAKGLLFAAVSRAERKFGLQKTFVLPEEDSHYAYFDSFPADRKISYGISKGMIHAEEISSDATGSKFKIRVPNDEAFIELPIPGEFNIRNALAAVSAAISLGLKMSVIAKGLKIEAVIPGRLESIKAGQPFTVIVDYAHTPDSLEKLLFLFRPLTKGKLFLVFGATGGGRDRLKRPEMGAIANRLADYIVVTDDDSYTEDRMQIIEQVASGIRRREGEGFWKIRDRRQAIRLVLSSAREGDTVLIAGKGCEPVQVIDGKRQNWDDRKVVREILSSAVKVEL